jgi:hypothetical protein
VASNRLDKAQVKGAPEIQSEISGPQLNRTVTLTLGEWEAWRRAAGLHIDPETAEVEWTYAQTLDPYGDDPNLPEECQQVGREYFARSPGSDVWVWFGDLPHATRNSLWEKHKSRLAFSAGLDFIPFALDYLERNFGPTSSLSDDEFGQAMKATSEAYLVKKTGREEAHDDPTEDR